MFLKGSFMVSRVIPVSPFDLVIFGATGDLARRKILPALFRRMRAGQMPDGSKIIGAARSDMDSSGFRDLIEEALAEFEPEAKDTPEVLEKFLNALEYTAVDAMGEKGWKPLKKLIRDDTVRAFYLSVGPSLFGEIAHRLHEYDIATPDSRIVVEKPLGHDLESAQELNKQLAESFAEKQIYRIDHYLGKETVLNLLVLRFANSLFTTNWGRNSIDHVQITVAESVGIEGRWGFYDEAGQMRDMIQNHLLQKKDFETNNTQKIDY